MSEHRNGDEPADRNKPGGVARASLIVGIIAVVMAVIPVLSFLAFLPALTALSLGVVTLVKHLPGRGRGMAGAILGGSALVLAITISISTIAIGIFTTAGSGDRPAVSDTAPSAETVEPEDEQAVEPENEQVVEPEPSDEPVAEPEPTAEPEPQAPTVPADIVYQGTGDSVLAIELPDGADSLSVATLSHNGSRNFAVWSLGADMAQQELMVNMIGGYQGTVLFNLQSGTAASALEITADGAWTVTVRSVLSLRQFEGASAAGIGDDALIYLGDAGAAALSHDGESNFAVWTYGSSTDLVVNEIGAYTGTVRWAAGPTVVAVSADGAWSIAVG